MSKDLRSYFDELLEKRPKDVVVVDNEVDPVYEASAIVEKFERENKFPLGIFQKHQRFEDPVGRSISAPPTSGLALSLGSPSVPQMVRDLAHREHQSAAGQGDRRQRRAVQRSDLKGRRKSTSICCPF